MNAWFSVLSGLFIVLFLVLVSLIGAGTAGLSGLFGVFIPYAAGLVFLIGVIARVTAWAKAPVPFRIPTTCGQAVSLPWFKSSQLDCPHTTWGVIGRMALEVLLFRSLFRNIRGEVRPGPRLTYTSAKWLWLFGLLFHYSFLTIVIRHLRFFTEPVPTFVELITTMDGFFEILLPTVFITDIAFIAAASYLFLRRVVIAQVRYISLPADYFALFLILGIGLSGVLMRQVFKVDLFKVKELTMGLTSLTLTAPDGIGMIFYVHLFLVCCLLAYFPFSKLMHAGGVFLSPTRNMANNNRMVRYASPKFPWDKEPKVHTYEEYEDEFRAKMKEVGLPVDKE